MSPLSYLSSSLQYLVISLAYCKNNMQWCRFKYSLSHNKQETSGHLRPPQQGHPLPYPPCLRSSVSLATLSNHMISNISSPIIVSCHSSSLFTAVKRFTWIISSPFMVLHMCMITLLMCVCSSSYHQWIFIAIHVLHIYQHVCWPGNNVLLKLWMVKMVLKFYSDVWFLTIFISFQHMTHWALYKKKLKYRHIYSFCGVFHKVSSQVYYNHHASAYTPHCASVLAPVCACALVATDS